MAHADEVRARVERFTPLSLSTDEWILARPAVVVAVLAGQPASPEQAKIYASWLCAFLAWLPVADWGRVSAPNVTAVLTPLRIAAFTSAAGMPRHSARSRDRARGVLLRLSQSATGVGRLRAARSHRAPVAGRVFWAALVGLGPFSVLAAAYRQAGYSLHGNAWAGLADELVLDLSGLPILVAARAGCARGESAGTVGVVQAAAAVLRDAPVVTSGVVQANTNSSKRTSTTQSSAVASASRSRPMSRAAALRHARRVQAAQAEQPVASVVADVAVLPQALAGMLAGWHPQDLDSARWALVEAAVKVAVAAYAPPSPASLRNVRSIVVPFAAWLHTRPGRAATGVLEPVEFLTDGAIDRYLAGPLAGQPDASRATVRSVLRRVTRNLDPGPKPEAIAYQPVQGPYSAAECARFVMLARHQPTAALRRALSAMVALGLGAGLGAEDQRAIAPCHIREVDLGSSGVALAVDVPGARARTVIVRAAYEQLLRDAVGLHAHAKRGAATPLCGDKPDRRNGANRVAAKTITATGTGVDIDAARLRATWLVACMSAPVPLGALLHASGLRTPRTLTDLLPYCPEPDPAAVAAVLHATGLTDTGLTDTDAVVSA